MHAYYAIFISLFLLACSSKKSAINTSNTKEKSALSQSKEIEFKNYFFEGMNQKILFNTDEAISYFKKAVSINPSSAAALHEISLLYASDRDYSSALNYAQQAVLINGENKWYVLQLAQMQKNMLQYENASKSFEKLVQLDPNNLSFLEDLMESYIRNAETKKAAALVDRAIAILGPSDELILQKQTLYLQAGEKEKAIEEALKLVANNPNDPKYINMLAQLYEQTGDKENAILQYQELIKLNPKDGVASLAVARYYKTKGENNRVKDYMKVVFNDEKLSPSLKLTILVDYIEESIKNKEVKDQTEGLIAIMQNVHPNSVQSFVSAGDFYMNHNDLENARTSYLKATTLDANSYPILVQLLTIDIELNNNTYLEQDSESAIAIFPMQPVFYLYNGNAKLALEKYADAVQVLQNGKDLVIDKNDILIDFYRSLGEANHALKEYNKADKNFEKSLELNPNQPFLLNNYSYYLSVRKENLERAAEMAKKANALMANQNSFEDTYGWVLFQQKKYVEAKKWIKKALENGGNTSGVIVEHYGDVLFMLGETEDAILQWEKAKELDGYSDRLETKIKEQKYVE